MEFLGKRLKFSRLASFDAGSRKVYLLERRLHHGLVGGTMMAVGLVLLLHDRRDFPWAMERRLTLVG